MNILQRIGDWLHIHGDVTVAGDQPGWYMRALLRHYGVNVLHITKHRAQHAPWWQLWAVDTWINVGRYEDFIAAQILADHGYTIIDPDPTGSWENVPPAYQRKLAAIQRRRMLEADPANGSANKRGVTAWQR